MNSDGETPRSRAARVTARRSIASVTNRITSNRSTTIFSSPSGTVSAEPMLGGCAESSARRLVCGTDRRLVLDDSNLLDVLRQEVGRVDLLCFTGDAAD